MAQAVLKGLGMNFKQLLFTLLTATSITFAVAACGSDEPVSKAEAVTTYCECAIESDPESSEADQAACEAYVTPVWATATQACFDCVTSTPCASIDSCFSKCPDDGE